MITIWKDAVKKDESHYSLILTCMLIAIAYLRKVDKALPEEKLRSGVRDMHRPER